MRTTVVIPVYRQGSFYDTVSGKIFKYDVGEVLYYDVVGPLATKSFLVREDAMEEYRSQNEFLLEQTLQTNQQVF